eukprot:Gb_05395 [translate_table: standard]
MGFANMSINKAVLIVYCVVIICSGPDLILAKSSIPHQRSHVPALFVFGDSLGDAGNNNYINTSARANFPPYGETFFRRPTGRFTNGRTTFDFIAQRLGLPFPPPFLKPRADFSHGINFASGGSGLLDSTGKDMNIIPLSHQIQQFANISSALAQRHGVDAARSFLSKSLYAVSAGGNDIGLNYLTNATFQNTTSPQDLVKLLLTKYSEYLSNLYRRGARNFILLDIPPLGCTPNSRLAGLSTWNGSCLKIANQLVIALNSGLRVLTSNLNQKHKGALTILNPDSYSFVLNIIHHGRAYGFSETKSACCGAGPFNTAVGCGLEIPEKKRGEYKEFLCKDPRKYVFWDGTHPTERVYFMVFRKIWSGNPSFISPFNLKTLIHKQSHKP